MACAVAAMATGYSSAASAAEWLFGPYVGITEKYTDNAFGTAENTKDDLITSLNTGFTLNGDGNHLQLAAEYDLSYDIYAKNSELNGFRHNLLASSDVELVNEHLFLETQIAFTEETLSRSGNTSFVDRTVSSDRTRVLNTRISPYYLQDFGGNATGLAQYTYSRVDFFETDVGAATSNPSDSQTHRIDLALGSGRNFNRTTWLLEILGVDSEVQNGDNLRRGTFSASGQMPINRTVALLGTTGWDEFDAENVDNQSISGYFIGGGVRLTPGPRTDLSLQVGHRYGTGIADMDLTYLISSEAVFTASYNVDIQTAGQSLADTDILDRDGELVNPNFTSTGYVDSITKAKTLSMSLSGVKGRNTYSATTSYVQRNFLSNGTNDEVVAVDGSYARQLSSQLELSLLGGYSEVLDAEVAGTKDTAIYGQAALNYQFNQSLSGSFTYGYFNRDSETDTSDLRENNISVSLRKSF
ncbi:MAG: TIGR03016 family PEP-CTERM system-associated outer membrane protein [Sneathiella sp.]|nr:MAG: TIGR03016 family PEP-CTERM system-associated outer membrane protein [Sneathiella sp.]